MSWQNLLVMLLLLISTAIVLSRCVCLMAHLSPRRWVGHKLQLFGLSSAYALMGGGAVGTLFGWAGGAVLMVVGLAGLFVFDRRA